MVYSCEICRELEIKNDLKGREIEEFEGMEKNMELLRDNEQSRDGWAVWEWLYARE